MTKTNGRRATKGDKIVATTMQDFGHESTKDIIRKRHVLTCELVSLEEVILELSAKIADARVRRARIDAILLGLGLVIGKR